jgi:hypothetical protein
MIYDTRHYWSLHFVFDGGSHTEFFSTEKKYLSFKTIEAAKNGRESILVSASYLGFMTSEEFYK